MFYKRLSLCLKRTRDSSSRMSLGSLLKIWAPWKAKVRLPVSVLIDGKMRLELFPLVSFPCWWRLKYCVNCSGERPFKHLKTSIAKHLLCSSIPFFPFPLKISSKFFQIFSWQILEALISQAKLNLRSQFQSICCQLPVKVSRQFFHTSSQQIWCRS